MRITHGSRTRDRHPGFDERSQVVGLSRGCQIGHHSVRRRVLRSESIAAKRAAQRAIYHVQHELEEAAAA